MRREDEDGTPHLAYFRTAEQLSFVWSGGMDRSVQVCPGGAGEPVVWEFDIREHVPDEKVFGHVAASDVLAMFKRACDAWTGERA